jgi:hypothetical protein
VSTAAKTLPHQPNTASGKTKKNRESHQGQSALKYQVAVRTFDADPEKAKNLVKLIEELVNDPAVLLQFVVQSNDKVRAFQASDKEQIFTVKDEAGKARTLAQFEANYSTTGARAMPGFFDAGGFKDGNVLYVTREKEETDSTKEADGAACDSVTDRNSGFAKAITIAIRKYNLENPDAKISDHPESRFLNSQGMVGLQIAAVKISLTEGGSQKHLALCNKVVCEALTGSTFGADKKKGGQPGIKVVAFRPFQARPTPEGCTVGQAVWAPGLITVLGSPEKCEKELKAGLQRRFFPGKVKAVHAHEGTGDAVVYFDTELHARRAFQNHSTFFDTECVNQIRLVPMPKDLQKHIAEQTGASERAAVPCAATGKRAASDRTEVERVAAASKAEAERAAAERVAVDQEAASAQRAAQVAVEQKAASDRAQAERVAAAQKVASDQAEAERVTAAAKAVAERAAASAKAKATRAAEQKVASDRAEAERVAAAQKVASDQAEVERVAAEQKTVSDQAEVERIAAEQKAASDQAEAERVAAEEKAASDQAEAERVAAEEKAEADELETLEARVITLRAKTAGKRSEQVLEYSPDTLRERSPPDAKRSKAVDGATGAAANANDVGAAETADAEKATGGCDAPAGPALAAAGSPIVADDTASSDAAAEGPADGEASAAERDSVEVMAATGGAGAAGAGTGTARAEETNASNISGGAASANVPNFIDSMSDVADPSFAMVAGAGDSHAGNHAGARRRTLRSSDTESHEREAQGRSPKRGEGVLTHSPTALQPTKRGRSLVDKDGFTHGQPKVDSPPVRFLHHSNPSLSRGNH